MELSKEQLENLRNRRISVLEEIFILTYTTSMTFADCWNMPISKRRWFVKRLLDQKEAENEATSGSMPSSPTSHIPRGKHG